MEKTEKHSLSHKEEKCSSLCLVNPKRAEENKNSVECGVLPACLPACALSQNIGKLEKLTIPKKQELNLPQMLQNL